MAREGMPNYIARKSKWTAVFRRGWKFFWPMLALLVVLTIIHLDTFGHPIAFLDGGHTPYTVKKVDSTCTEEGNISYYICWDCDKLYVDNKLTEEISKKDTIIPVKPHTLVHKDGVGSTQYSEGMVEHWICTGCSKTFADENGTQELDTVVIPKLVDSNHKHKLELVKENVEGYCGASAGKTTESQFYTCNDCDKIFADKKAENEITNIFGHKVKFVEAKASTCTERGNVAHYVCTTCKKLYSDAACTNEISLEDVLLGYGHKLHKGETKDKTLKGYKELYFCLECDRMHKIYLSEEGERELLRPFTVELFGIRVSGWTLILAAYMFICIFLLSCTLVRIKCQYIEFYDDYVIQRRGVFWKRSRKTIFPQASRVSVRKHFFNYGNVYIDVVGPWDVDMTGLARPEDVREYLVDHMINPSAVDGISNNPYIAALGVAQDSIF